MKSTKNILCKLNTRLLEGVPNNIVAKACNQNRWFTPQTIRDAVEAIAKNLLDENRLDVWMARYPTLPTQQPQRVLIIMAGNIPLVGIADLICVLMAGHHALIKPSHKDRALMEWVVETIHNIDPATPIAIYTEGDNTPFERVIATGGDSAVAHFRTKYADMPTLVRGSRYSAAVVTHQTSPAEWKLLAHDIYSYSGLGCRNVSLLFVPHDMEPVATPHSHLTIDQKYTNNYRQSRAIYTLSGVEFIDTGISCLVEGDQFPASPSTITLVRYSTTEQIDEWLHEHDSQVQCVVANSDTICHPRRVEFGTSQSPTLDDYADGVDTMEFLS